MEHKRLKPLFHSSQKPTRKLAASAFKYCDWMKVLAASLRVGFCDEWKRAGLKLISIINIYAGLASVRIIRIIINRLSIGVYQADKI